MPAMNKKIWIMGAFLLLGLGLYYLRSPGVADRYSEEAEQAVAAGAVRALSEQHVLDAQMLANLLSEIDKIEASMLQMNETHLALENPNAVYTVQQEEDIAAAYSRYLILRKALFHIAFRHLNYSQVSNEEEQDASFLLAYASGLTLYRNAVVFVVLFNDKPNARRKLNEADPVQGIPSGMFDEMYANITSPENVALVLDGVAEFSERRVRLEQSEFLELEGLDGILERLNRNEEELAEAYAQLAAGQRDVIWTRLRTGVTAPTYSVQSFLSMMIGHIRNPIHSPGLTAESIAADIRPLLHPGDILLTRRDGYLSNTFLPGTWGHAAMYLGSADDIRALGDHPDVDELLASVGFDGNDKDGHPYAAIEAIGEGVRLSSLEFALHANTVAVLRPRLTDAEKQIAVVRAIQLKGTPYDFAFDVASQDKIICTELVYRAYAPHLDVLFEEVMGTKTLKPDGMLRALSPLSTEPLSDFVLYGVSEDGGLQTLSLDALMETVSEDG